jgi:hypothetical protein
LHLGVIISGATTFLSYFFAGPPVSFYLAQCASLPKIENFLQGLKGGTR